MVKKPSFELSIGNKKIVEFIKHITYEDKDKGEADEITITFATLLDRVDFGTNIELKLGYENAMYKCGSFFLQAIEKEYKHHTTTIRATAVNFITPIKENKSRTWQNTTLKLIAQKISEENSLEFHNANIDDIHIVSVLQENKNDIEFLYEQCVKNGLIMLIKNQTIIITTKDARIPTVQSPKNTKLPSHTLDIKELHNLRILDANRNFYNAVVLEWHDELDGKTKEIKVGDGTQIYKERVAKPKSDAEAFRIAEAKLHELQKGGINGSFEMAGENIKAGAKISFTGIKSLKDLEFSIVSVRHRFDSHGYFIDVEFEG